MVLMNQIVTSLTAPGTSRGSLSTATAGNVASASICQETVTASRPASE